MKKVYFYILLPLILIFVALFCYFKICNSTISSETYLKLYEEIIDRVLVSNDKELNSSEYIAINANSFGISNDKEKQELLNFLTKYTKTIVIGNYSLLENEEFMENGILKGIYIDADNIKRIGNKVTINVFMYKSSEYLNAYTFESKYFNNKWNIKLKKYSE